MKSLSWYCKTGAIIWDERLRGQYCSELCRILHGQAFSWSIEWDQKSKSWRIKALAGQTWNPNTENTLQQQPAMKQVGVLPEDWLSCDFGPKNFWELLTKMQLAVLNSVVLKDVQDGPFQYLTRPFLSMVAFLPWWCRKDYGLSAWVCCWSTSPQRRSVAESKSPIESSTTSVHIVASQSMETTDLWSCFLSNTTRLHAVFRQRTSGEFLGFAGHLILTRARRAKNPNVIQKSKKTKNITVWSNQSDYSTSDMYFSMFFKCLSCKVPCRREHKLTRNLRFVGCHTLVSTSTSQNNRADDESKLCTQVATTSKQLAAADPTFNQVTIWRAGHTRNGCCRPGAQGWLTGHILSSVNHVNLVRILLGIFTI